MSPQPLALTDNQYDAVCRACEPILPGDRDAFLRALANVLRGEPQPLGDGSVFRAIRALQREFWQPPPPERSWANAHTRRRVGEAIP
jgi:hypothetical protein